MKTIDQVSSDKLRGGFYSPVPLVAVCLERIQELLSGGRTGLRLLEPSAGDGAFIRGLRAHPLRENVDSVLAAELIAEEAAACAEAGRGASFQVQVRQGSFLNPSLVSEEEFDAAVGNPPFVRFQFVGDEERLFALDVAEKMGLTLKGVSNLWIPIFLGALNKLREGGAFAFIIPAECLTGISASTVRRWLLRNVSELRVDLFSPGSFPGVLQEIVILSGRRASMSGSATITVRESWHSERVWEHSVKDESPTWTRYLLNPVQLLALEQASHLPEAKSVGSFAKFSVATVTGANDFFSVDSVTVEKYQLDPWVVPLLPRIRHAEGLTYGELDHSLNVSSGLRAHLLDFSRGPSPENYPGALRYLAEGEEQKLHERYKCRIRDPWYCVPVVPAGSLLLSKRSHFYPRVVVNEAKAITTDTIYQAKMLPSASGLVEPFAASFHNSLTLLSAEIEGRSFGGGVLELVPSEVGRLRIFVPAAMGDDLIKLDEIARSSNEDRDEDLIRETDRRLSKHISGLDDATLTALADSRMELQKRRLDRN
ncbi:Eco57I restriction-modification methylase domain-containing protein [[Kitasatospora] papulosa]|uniref:Eco57I restriction-modification methylase domain-containing protein n=1 Tax=[Kitasatospora] papulosa TaxID=1464011 RepID=UPI0036BAD201